MVLCKRDILRDMNMNANNILLDLSVTQQTYNIYCAYMYVGGCDTVAS